MIRFFRVVKHLLKKMIQIIALKHSFVQNGSGLANDCTEALNEELIVGLGVAKTVCTLPNGSHSRQRRAWQSNCHTDGVSALGGHRSTAESASSKL